MFRYRLSRSVFLPFHVHDSGQLMEVHAISFPSGLTTLHCALHGMAWVY